MALSDWALPNEDGSWTGVDGTVYPSLKDLFEQLVSQWRSTNIGLEQAELDLEEMTAELPAKYTETETLRKELKKLDAELKEAVAEVVVLSPTKFHGTTFSIRKTAIIHDAAAVEWIIAAEMPRSWLTLSPEGLKAIKDGVTDRMSKYAGLIPEPEVAEYRDKKSATLYASELFNRNKTEE